MPSLLDLPNEILDEIIDKVLSDGQTFITSGVIRKRAADWKSDDIPVAYIQNDALNSPNASGLLLTCRKINRQTLHRIKRSSTVHKMDLALIDAAWYYPTWTQIPTRQGAVPEILDRLEIRIIPCRTGEKDIFQEVTFIQTWRLEETLCSIIERFLAVGVNGSAALHSPELVAHAKQTFPLNLRVRTIVLDISAADSTALDIPLSHTDVPVRSVEGFVHSEHDILYPIDPETATAMYETMLARLISGIGFSQKSRILLERVGKLHVCGYDDTKGKRGGDIELDEFVAPDWQHPNPEELEERLQIQQKRKELGVWNGVPEDETAEE